MLLDPLLGSAPEHRIHWPDTPDQPLYFWWRVEADCYPLDGEQLVCTARFVKWPIIAATEATVVVELYGERKRVLKNAHKRWAYPTAELAYQSWQIRKRRHQMHVENSLARAKALNALAQRKFLHD